ncbi:General secretion pathway, M protein [Bhargavaea cecembensis DSE10]|uniref:General secretion pathway, M protein n=1 Tax=Bhargavaea cecembensis DSE10 TaxID=1235279 RepID=M7P5K6_9BACL|nr:type II secretion system protein GspM [Bhargavaea cecembensis]EMR05809.1 General secretion pathway, M protein [Bhargavaea cecembensis DSE10]
MNRFNMNRKETILVVLSVLFLIALLLYSYFMLFQPARETRLQAQQTLQTERQVLSSLQQQAAGETESEPASTLPLQRRVPVNPAEEVVLLQVGKAEVVSGTEIQNVAFSTGEMVIENPPEGVESVSELLTTVQILSPDYDGILTFIEEVERLERITVTNSVTFTGPSERTEEAQEDEPIAMEITFSSFYRPDLTTLEGETPTAPAPPPSLKDDPFPFDDETEQED